MMRTFASPLDEVSSVARDQLGALREEGGSLYKYVKIQNTTATVAGAKGDPVAYKASTGYLSNTVVLDLTDADPQVFCAGCLEGTVTGTAGTAYYGWIKIKGPVTAVAAITSGEDGVPVYLTTTDKTFAKAVEADTAADYKQVAGICIDASDKTIALDCPY
jgi:hypothetical protein